jgi:hypothetical protein
MKLDKAIDAANSDYEALYKKHILERTELIRRSNLQPESGISNNDLDTNVDWYNLSEAQLEEVKKLDKKHHLKITIATVMDMAASAIRRDQER